MNTAPVASGKFPAHSQMVEMMKANLAENMADPDTYEAHRTARELAVGDSPAVAPEMQDRIAKAADKVEPPTP